MKWKLALIGIALVVAITAAKCPDPTDTPSNCPTSTQNLAGFDSVSITASSSIDIQPGQRVELNASARPRLKDPSAETVPFICGVTFADKFVGVDPQNDAPLSGFLFGFDSSRKAYGTAIHLSC